MALDAVRRSNQASTGRVEEGRGRPTLRASTRLVAITLLLALAAAFAGASAADDPTPMLRGKHVSGFIHHYLQPHGPGQTSGSPTGCSTPGGGNYRTDCHSVGAPVNETWITTDGSGNFYAGANDYNSYNGQGQDGFYWSSDGVSWNDGGPIDVFPHDPNNAAATRASPSAGTAPSTTRRSSSTTTPAGSAGSSSCAATRARARGAMCRWRRTRTPSSRTSPRSAWIPPTSSSRGRSSAPARA